jgi:hypothetical protein
MAHIDVGCGEWSSTVQHMNVAAWLSTKIGGGRSRHEKEMDSLPDDAACCRSSSASAA